MFIFLLLLEQVLYLKLQPNYLKNMRFSSTNLLKHIFVKQLFIKVQRYENIICTDLRS